MQEFVIRNIWDHDLIIVAKDYTTASFSFLKYLSEREYQILQRHFLVSVVTKINKVMSHFKDTYTKITG